MLSFGLFFGIHVTRFPRNKKTWSFRRQLPLDKIFEMCFLNPADGQNARVEFVNISDFLGKIGYVSAYVAAWEFEETTEVPPQMTLKHFCKGSFTWYVNNLNGFPRRPIGFFLANKVEHQLLAFNAASGIHRYL